jgi:hypothetical protein
MALEEDYYENWDAVVLANNEALATATELLKGVE